MLPRIWQQAALTCILARMKQASSGLPSSRSSVATQLGGMAGGVGRSQRAGHTTASAGNRSMLCSSYLREGRDPSCKSHKERYPAREAYRHDVNSAPGACSTQHRDTATILLTQVQLAVGGVLPHICPELLAPLLKVVQHVQRDGAVVCSQSHNSTGCTTHVSRLPACCVVCVACNSEGANLWALDQRVPAVSGGPVSGCPAFQVLAVLRPHNLHRVPPPKCPPTWLLVSAAQLVGGLDLDGAVVGDVQAGALDQVVGSAGAEDALRGVLLPVHVLSTHQQERWRGPSGGQ